MSFWFRQTKSIELQFSFFSQLDTVLPVAQLRIVEEHNNGCKLSAVAEEYKQSINYFLLVFHQNIEFLRGCGIQEWILDGDESFKDFFAWFNQNISSHNILTDEELVEYVILIEFVFEILIRRNDVIFICTDEMIWSKQINTSLMTSWWLKVPK